MKVVLLFPAEGAIRELIPPKNERTLAGQERNRLTYKGECQEKYFSHSPYADFART
jgi:hypothetical protein